MQLLFGPRERMAGIVRDGLDGRVIAIRVALRIRPCARCFAQHIKGEAITLLGLLPCVRDRPFDSLSKHELLAENPHRLTQRLADHRLSAPRNQALDHRREIGVPFFPPIDNVPREH